MDNATLSRFEKYVQPEPNTGCFLWVGAVTGSGGYGVFSVDDRIHRAHRLAYEHHVGPIPNGMVIDHVRARGCCGPACVNPAHLEAVTPLENSRRGDSGLKDRVKTHCPRGHAYTAENTRLNGGGRACRACERQRSRRAGASA